MKYLHKRNRKTNKDVQRSNRFAERVIKQICREKGVRAFLIKASTDKSLRISGIPSVKKI